MKNNDDKIKAVFAEAKEEGKKPDYSALIDALAEAEVIVPVRVILSREAEELINAKPEGGRFEDLSEEEKEIFENGINYAPYLLKETVELNNGETAERECMIVLSSEDEVKDEVKDAYIKRMSAAEAFEIAEGQGDRVGVSLNTFSDNFRIPPKLVTQLRFYCSVEGHLNEADGHMKEAERHLKELKEELRRTPKTD